MRRAIRAALAATRRRRRRRLRRLARARPRPVAHHRGRRRRARCAVGPRSRSPSPGCRGPIAGSAPPPATAPASRSPGWYDHVFRHPGAEGVSRFFVDAAHALRRQGLPASPDHVIGASRLASSLAALRQRPRPGLAEVLDAAEAVLGGLPLVVDELVVGDAIGAVPDDAPQVPLARDLAAAARAARLKPGGVGPRWSSSTCARRTGGAGRTCCTGCGRSASSGGRWRRAGGRAGTFRETWELRWEPELSVRLVERAGHGTTVVAAATSVLVERARGTSRLAEASARRRAGAAGRAARRAGAGRRRARPAGRRRARRRRADGRARPAGRRACATATSAAPTPAGCGPCSTSWSCGCWPASSGPPMGLDDDAAQAMVERMSAVQAALAVVDHPARRTRPAARCSPRWPTPARGHGLVHGPGDPAPPRRRGWPPAAVEARLGRALTPGTPAATGAAFVEGFLAGSGTVLLHDEQLLAAVDAWVASLPPEAFADVVALLRRTFGAFEPAERRQLGQLLATGAVARVLPAGADLDDERVARPAWPRSACSLGRCQTAP